MKTILTILFINLKSIISNFIMRQIKLFTLLIGLFSFFGFFSVTHAQVIEGDVTLNSQAQVNSFAGNFITGNLTIEGSDIDDLTALSTLDSVGGDLNIYGNTPLTNLYGLNNLTSVRGSLNVGIIEGEGEQFLCCQPKGNPALTNLDGLSNLSSVDSGLYISFNDALTNLDGLSNLTSVGALGIGDNDVLTNLDGLSNLTSVAGDMVIGGNDLLTNLDGLSNLTFVGGDMGIQSNNSLTNLDGLSNLTFVGGVLLIHSSKLTNLAGLNNLNSVGGNLDIIGNDFLTNLDGLDNLASVGGGLHIWDNRILGHFCGLYMLLSTNGLVADYLVTENLVNPTQQEIIDGGACLTAIGENELFPRQYELHQNYPNPFNPSTTIEFNLPKSSDVRIEIYNTKGQKIKTLLNKKMAAGNHQVEFNAQDLSSGAYFYRIEVADPARQTGEFQDVLKLILMK